ncbi:MAG: hypothetical protein LBH68_03080 [Bifidobacteriaceae bacterium]|nr:hypothetical protein [Bifidobacteriaceae bacterium]
MSGSRNDSTDSGAGGAERPEDVDAAETPAPAPDLDDEATFAERWDALAQDFGDSLPDPLRDWASGRGVGHRQIQRSIDEYPELAEPDESDTPGAEDSGRGAVEQVPLSGPRDWSPREVPEHFEPPTPPPVFAAAPILVIGWLALLGGLAILFAWAMFRASLPIWLAQVGGAALTVGAATLIWQMPARRETGPDDPDDPDDGAEV